MPHSPFNRKKVLRDHMVSLKLCRRWKKTGDHWLLSSHLLGVKDQTHNINTAHSLSSCYVCISKVLSRLVNFSSQEEPSEFYPLQQTIKLAMNQSVSVATGRTLLVRISDWRHQYASDERVIFSLKKKNIYVSVLSFVKRCAS